VTPARRKGEKSTANSIIELVVIVVIALGLALGIQAFLIKPYKIPSESMVPTLQVGQRVLVILLRSLLNRPPGEGAVEGAGIEVQAREPFGQEPADGAFSGAGRAVDRDDRSSFRPASGGLCSLLDPLAQPGRGRAVLPPHEAAVDDGRRPLRDLPGRRAELSLPLATEERPASLNRRRPHGEKKIRQVKAALRPAQPAQDFSRETVHQAQPLEALGRLTGFEAFREGMHWHCSADGDNLEGRNGKGHPYRHVVNGSGREIDSCGG